MTDSSETPAAQPSATELAALLAARLCHDFISPASAIASGLDLLEDPTAQDMREDAMGLIAQSARKLVDMLAFSRVAFGASASAESFDARELETLARGVFAHIRPELEWSVEPASLNKAAARTILNLVQIAGGALPTGGTARVRAVEADGRFAISIEAEGARARIRPEIISGLRGEPLPEGVLAGHWVQSYYLHCIVDSAGGQIAAEAGEERVSFAAWVPV